MSLSVPTHVAIILDGNRRWAKAKGLPSLVGHSKGFDNVQPILDHAIEIGIKIITVFAFSTENWNRSETEVNYLMKLFEKMIDENLAVFNQKGIQFRHLGSVEKLPSVLQGKIKQAVETTKNNNKLIFCAAINYGGRDELVRAVRKIIDKKISSDQINEQLISDNLDTAGLPDPDLIIRTSGEQRLSGFLLWESNYSELYFTKTTWPDFSSAELDKAIAEFNARERRLGK